MRTTVRLDDRLLREAKAVAAQERRTLTAVIDDALRQFLARRSGPRNRVPAKLITFGSGGLRPGVDLDDTAALIDLIEAGEPLDKRR
ncbi:MAG: type II toxin-antitoxin system VapB family antitoxin [Chloroflexota bacterium]|nr:type II toxin-antitoxin system VapB family antitoxin [Candidatus Limnocylindria bacterium]